MKKFAWILIFVLAFSLVLGACGELTETNEESGAPEAATEAAPEAATEAPAAPMEPFRVAVHAERHQ